MIHEVRLALGHGEVHERVVREPRGLEPLARVPALVQPARDGDVARAHEERLVLGREVKVRERDVARVDVDEVHVAVAVRRDVAVRVHDRVEQLAREAQPLWWRQEESFERNSRNAW